MHESAPEIGESPNAKISMNAADICQRIRAEMIIGAGDGDDDANGAAYSSSSFGPSSSVNVLLAKLRFLAAQKCRESRLAKQHAVEARDRMDRQFLDLQSLFYEQHHLQLELSRCKELVTTYQHIPLQAESEWADATDDRPALPDDPHLRMIARLRFELDERRRLLSLWTEENQLKEAEIDLLKKGNQMIEKIDAQYDALLKATATLKKTSEYTDSSVDEPMVTEESHHEAVLDRLSSAATTPTRIDAGHEEGPRSEVEENEISEEEDEGEIKENMDESL